ncbi:Bgt-20661 [Blumeria graminis f. sp. tritici]|uniref:Bgt-20661 n=2 Tax=Blumeria graminis f. sp. tritici TaxID=62690 RepID=A0A9X9L9H9_BLUGR|nr:Bgt-20661 [Blumeria graminis f. sp. tritici]
MVKDMSVHPVQTPPAPPPSILISVPKAGEGLLTEIPLSTTSAPDNRNQKDILMFQIIACILDDAVGVDHLPQ